MGADTVSEEREDDEVDGGEHAAADASLRLDAVVHDGVPVLAGQDLRKTDESDGGGHKTAEQRKKKKSN